MKYGTICIINLLLTSYAWGNDTYTHQVGSRLRLHLSILPAPLIGTLTTINRDSLIIVDASGAKIPINRRLIQKTFISLGKQHPDPFKLALYTGLVAGVIGGYLQSEEYIRGNDAMLAVALRWGGIGFIGGGIWGAIEAGTRSSQDIWKPIVRITVPIE